MRFFLSQFLSLLSFSCAVPEHEGLARSWKNLRALSQNKALEAYDFVVVDTELTGMRPRRDEIVSIGAVRIKNMRIVPHDTFYSLVRPTMNFQKKSTLIHRLTPQALSKAPKLELVLHDFLSFAGSSLFVGHHVGMDMAFLSRASQKIFGGALKNPCIDTMRLAQAYREECFSNYYERFNLQISYNLSELAEQYKIPNFPTHNALTDAMQTAYLFLFLIRKLQGGQIHSLKELHAVGKSNRLL